MTLIKKARAQIQFEKYWNEEELQGLKTFIKDEEMIKTIKLVANTAYLSAYLDSTNHAIDRFLGK